MQFAKPQALWLLLVIPPALVAFFWWAGRKRERLIAGFIHARLLPDLISGFSRARQRWRWAAILLAVLCLIVALARPQWGFTWEEVKQRGLDVIVAVDVSKSMLARDITPNRLARAKLAALDLMQLAKSDRLGVVAFAGSAFLQCPLTIDDVAFRQSIDAIDVNSISQGGTAVAEAIEVAATAFKEGENYKALVILSDGENHAEGALEAAKKAAAAGVQIFTVGIGTPEGDILRAKDDQGVEDYVRDEQGNAVKSSLHEELLQQLASATERGFYLRLEGGKAMDVLYEKGLAPLPKNEANEKLMKRYHERFHWPLGLAIVLLTAEMFFPARSRDKSVRDRGQPSSRRRTNKAVATFSMGLALVLLHVCAIASTDRALRDYKAGKYDRALEGYKELSKRKSGDPRLHFNAGAAAYRDRQFNEAAKEFNEALGANDLELQAKAYYNRGNTHYCLGEENADPKQKSEQWEKAVRDFQSSLKLNPQDNDAKFNHDFVKRRLEELKQQQQQQPSQDKQDQEKQDDQNQDQQQQQGNQNQQPQDQQQQPQANQNQNENQNQNPGQQKQEPQPSDQKQQQSAQNREKQNQPSQKQQDQNKAQQQAQAGKEGEKKDQEQKAAAPGQLTPEQARQLLDSQRGDEKIFQYRNERKPVEKSKPFKDW